MGVLALVFGIVCVGTCSVVARSVPSRPDPEPIISFASSKVVTIAIGAVVTPACVGVALSADATTRWIAPVIAPFTVISVSALACDSGNKVAMMEPLAKVIRIVAQPKIPCRNSSFRMCASSRPRSVVLKSRCAKRSLIGTTNAVLLNMAVGRPFGTGAVVVVVVVVVGIVLVVLVLLAATVVVVVVVVLVLDVVLLAATVVIALVPVVTVVDVVAVVVAVVVVVVVVALLVATLHPVVSTCASCSGL